jgi:hypothetical protein
MLGTKVQREKGNSAKGNRVLSVLDVGRCGSRKWHHALVA